MEKVDKLSWDLFYKIELSKINKYQDIDLKSLMQAELTKKDSIIRNNGWYIPQFFNLKLKELENIVRSNEELKRDKWKAFANKHFDLLNPELGFLNADTTKFWFITLRPKLNVNDLSEKEIICEFRNSIQHLANSDYWEMVWGCIEITSAGVESIHCHLLCVQNKGNATAKKNPGKAGVINKGIKDRILNNSLFSYGEAGIDVEVNKGIDNVLGRAKYIKGNKAAKDKDVDISATRKWRLEYDIPPTICFKGNVPSEIDEA